jgi:hypothetical protein
MRPQRVRGLAAIHAPRASVDLTISADASADAASNDARAQRFRARENGERAALLAAEGQAARAARPSGAKEEASPIPVRVPDPPDRTTPPSFCMQAPAFARRSAEPVRGPAVSNDALALHLEGW